MLKKILSMLLLGMLFIKPVYANTTESSLNPDEMMTYYYKNKDINKALDIIQQLSDSKILEQAKHSFTPVVGFIIGIIGENENIEERIHKLSISPQMQECVSVAEKLLKQYPFEEILTDPDKIQDERGLDLLWGVFGATGNPQVPETIRTFVEKNKISKAPIGQKTRQDLVVMSAIWSLESNAKQHDIVAPFAEFPPQSDNMGDRNIITFYKKATQKRNK